MIDRVINDVLKRSVVRQFSVVGDGIGSRSSFDGLCECAVEVAPSVMYEAGWGAGTQALIGVVRDGEIHDASSLCLLRELHCDASESKIGACVGDYCVFCTVWPSQTVTKGEIVCNSVLVKGMFGGSHHVGVLDVVVMVPQEEGVLKTSVVSSCTISLSAGRPSSFGNGNDGEMSPAVELGTPVSLKMGDDHDGTKTKKKKKSRVNKSAKVVHMSPSMRRTSGVAAEDMVASDDAATPSSDMSTKKNKTAARVSQQHVFDVLVKRGKVMDKMLRSVVLRHFSAIGYVMEGNYYSFQFLDVPLTARIDSMLPHEQCDGGSVVVHRFDATCEDLKIHIESIENEKERLDTTVDEGYARDAVECIASDDEVVSQTVFKAAYSGYSSLQSLEGSDDITGVDSYVNTLRNWVSFPLQHYEEFCSQGAHPPSGVLLHGPPGTGKTLLARWVARESRAKLFIINGSEVMSEFLGESEKCLSAIFRAAVSLAPSIIFIDEIDALGPSRETSIGLSNAATRLVATLAGALDSIHGHPVMVIGATNRVDSLDESLRRPSRLERELEIGVPDPQARLQILSTLLSRAKHAVDADGMSSLASRAHGYVGADLVALCSEASMIALRRYVRNAGELLVTLADLETALHHTKPSALREFSSDIPNLSLADVGGHAELKQKLKEVVEWPIKFEKSLDRMGAVPPKGVLLCGPPGCSKTLLVKAIAGECRLNFFSVKGPELMSKYVGESEKAIAHIFEKARKASPAIVFFDEIDGLVGSRVQQASNGVDVSERVLSQMLQEMDGVKGKDDKVVIIAATNRMDRLDKALLRPGRFDRVLQVTLPRDQDRREIFQIHLRHIPVDETVTLEFLVETTDGFSGADIASLCQKAAMHALRTSEPESSTQVVTKKDFIAALHM